MTLPRMAGLKWTAGLSTRARNVCLEAGCKSSGDVRRLAADIDRMLSMPRCGPKTVDEIRSWCGMRLRPDDFNGTL